MSAYQVPLANVMLLQRVLEEGGTMTCSVRRAEGWDPAIITTRLEGDTAHLQVEFKSIIGTLRLQRGDSANHLHLRDFIQDLANERTQSIVKALALIEAHEYVNAALPSGHIAYITPTPWPATPFAVVITNNVGEMCAVACGSSKENLAEKVRAKLEPTTEATGEQV